MLRGVMDIMNDVKTASEMPPPTLYKYCPPERIDILENLAIRFSRPSEFNDHFDSHYLVPRDQGSKAKAARLRLKSHLGVFCLTERPDDHLMWVNYARNHTGFVIGFNARAAFFREESRLLRKVDYQPTPPVLEDASVNACFVKSAVWISESEWRCVRVFEQSENRIVDIDASLVTHVIFGSRMEDWRIARVAVFAGVYEHTSFLLSFPSPSGFAFENKPKTLTFCEHCSGSGYTMTDLD
jgi:Protein of unknown function (DUF2971)